MFKVHTKDGKTTPIDLTNPEDKAVWTERFSSQEYQESITGITIVNRCGGKNKCAGCGDIPSGDCERCGLPLNESKCNMGVQFSMPRPVNMKNVFYQLEVVEPRGRVRGGERIICHAGDVSLVLMSHANQPASRVSLAKIGKRRYNPFIG